MKKNSAAKRQAVFGPLPRDSKRVVVRGWERTELLGGDTLAFMKKRFLSE